MSYGLDDFLEDTGELLSDVATLPIDVITGKDNQLIDATEDAANELKNEYDEANQKAEDQYAYLENLIKDSIDQASDVPSDVIEVIKDIPDIVESIPEFVDDTINALETAVDSAGDWVEETWNELARDMQDELDIIVDEWDWEGAFIATGLMLGGVPIPIASLGIFGKDTYEQAYDTLTGEKQDAYSEIEDLADEIKANNEEYGDLIDDLMKMMLFFDEIYAMAASNRADKYYNVNIQKKINELEKLQAEYKAKYDDFDNLNKNSVLAGLVFSPTLIVAGLFNDFREIFDTDLSWTEKRDAVWRIVGLIISIVLLVATWGSDASSWVRILGLVAMYVGLDYSYGDAGIARGAAVMLDMVVNDILKVYKIDGLEKVGGLDRDSEYHAEATATLHAIFQLSVIATSLYATWFNGSDGLSKAEKAKKLAESSRAIDSLQTINSTIENAKAAYDLYTADDRFQEAEAEKKKIFDRLMEAERKLQSRYRRLRAMRIINHQKDWREILNDTDEIINDFVVKSANMKSEYLDPESMIRVNSRYKSEPIVNYGFEEIFSSANIPGEDEYYKSILNNI